MSAQPTAALERVLDSLDDAPRARAIGFAYLDCYPDGSEITPLRFANDLAAALDLGGPYLKPEQAPTARGHLLESMMSVGQATRKTYLAPLEGALIAERLSHPREYGAEHSAG